MASNPFIQQLRGLIKTIRPKQWVKNGFLFVALFFDRKLLVDHYFITAFAGFLLFCAVSSAIYILNDLTDIEADRQHPAKKNRPLPSGILTKKWAVIALTLLIGAAIPVGFLISTSFGMILTGYFLLQVAYSYLLKNIVILDVMTISAGFVLRVGAGVALVDVERFSPWLYIFTTAISLFLGFSKRRQELVQMDSDGQKTRKILSEYSLDLLDYLNMIVVTMTVITYALYTFSAEGLPDNHVMMLTIPFVLYGMFRYLQLMYVKGVTSPPDEIILQDRPIQIAVLLWGLTIGIILYVFN